MQHCLSASLISPYPVNDDCDTIAIYDKDTSLSYTHTADLISLSEAQGERSVTEQLLHLVFGGELEELDDITFKDLEQLEIVGIFPNYKLAYDAWKAAAQKTVDNAHTRYFIVHLHKLLEPLTENDQDAA